MSKEQVIKKLLEESVQTGIKYHSPLPVEIAPWYVYTGKSGHRVLCVLRKNVTPDMTESEYENLLVSAPVKTVLNGYAIQKGFVIVDCEYDPFSGFAGEERDREFDESANTMHTLTVGELYHPGMTDWPEAVEYNYFSNNHELRFILKNPSRYVIEVIRKMPLQLGLFTRDDIILLVYRFTDYKKQLMPIHGYSPFSIHMVPENMRTLPQITPGVEHEELLRIHLVDAGSGILKAARAVTLSSEFSEALCDAIVAQSKVPLSADYEERLKAIDIMYPDNDSLMESCGYKC